MTLQQLEYILAVEQYRHFAKAAEHCRVTQPTLSAMIQKLEDELDTRIFDRSRQPIAPTPIGLHILAQAREVLAQAARIKAMVEEAKGSFTGTFNLGILPTIAPYLLPRFFPQLMKKYDVAVWAHHGIFCSGEDFDQTFGLMDTVEKSAEILVKVLSMGGKRQTITAQNFRDLAKDFKVTLPERFLSE